MFKVNKKVEYALMALRHMTDKPQGELTSAKEICAVHKTPFDMTSRVLQILTQHQILKSEHGAHGGYLIQKDLSKVTLLKLSEMLLGPVPVANCLHEEGTHGCDLIHHCNIVSPMEKLNDRMKTFYNSISIKDLLLGTLALKNRPAHHRDTKKNRLAEMEFSV